jgi:hypothetical protein
MLPCVVVSDGVGTPAHAFRARLGALGGHELVLITWRKELALVDEALASTENRILTPSG